MKRKKMLVSLLVGFIVLLALLLLFSRTLFVWSLPKVTLAFSREGTFTHSLEGKSTIDIAPDDSAFPYTASFTFPKDTDYLFIGDTVDVTIPAIRYGTFGGEIIAIQYNAGDVLVRVGFSPLAQGKTIRLNGNENIEIAIEKTSLPFECIVPKSSVLLDGAGQPYLLYVQETQGAFGRIYVLGSMYVSIWAESSGEIALREATPIEHPIVVSSDREVHAGDQIRIFP